MAECLRKVLVPRGLENNYCDCPEGFCAQRREPVSLCVWCGAFVYVDLESLCVTCEEEGMPPDLGPDDDFDLDTFPFGSTQDDTC